MLFCDRFFDLCILAAAFHLRSFVYSVCSYRQAYYAHTQYRIIWNSLDSWNNLVDDVTFEGNLVGVWETDVRVTSKLLYIYCRNFWILYNDICKRSIDEDARSLSLSMVYGIEIESPRTSKAVIAFVFVYILSLCCFFFLSSFATNTCFSFCCWFFRCFCGCFVFVGGFWNNFIDNFDSDSVCGFIFVWFATGSASII